MQRIIPLQVLEPQGSQNLEVFFRGWMVAMDDRFMGLLKHKCKLHAVFWHVVCVQEAVKFEVKLPWQVPCI